MISKFPYPKILEDRIGLALLFMTFFAFSFKQGVLNASTSLLGIVGLVMLLRNFKENILALKSSLFLVFIGLILLPILISLPYSSVPKEGIRALISFLRYFFAFSFIFWISRDQNYMRILARMITYLMLFWCIDALIQQFFGRNLFGYAYDGMRITGMFHPKYHLGYVLAVLSPLFLETLRRDYLPFPLKRYFIFPILGIFIGVIILSNTRAAWLVLGLSIIIWISWNIFWRNFSLKLALCLILGMGLGAVLALQNSSVNQRVKSSIGLFSKDDVLRNKASSSRIALWKTGLLFLKEKPMRGLGVGGSEYAYSQRTFEERGNQDYALFPHLSAFEVLIETGIIGLSAYLIFYIGIFVLFIRNRAGAEWFLVSLLAAMPLNTHVAFYGSYASSLIWLPLMIGLALRYHQKGRN